MAVVPPGHRKVCSSQVLILWPNPQAIRVNALSAANLTYAFLPTPLVYKAPVMIEEAGVRALLDDGGDGGAGTLQGHLRGQAGGVAPQAGNTCGHNGGGQRDRQLPPPLTTAAKEH